MSTIQPDVFSTSCGQQGGVWTAPGSRKLLRAAQSNYKPAWEKSKASWNVLFCHTMFFYRQGIQPDVWKRSGIRWTRDWSQTSEVQQLYCLSWRTKSLRQLLTSRIPRARWGGVCMWPTFCSHLKQKTNNNKKPHLSDSVKVSYIENRIAALNTAGVTTDKRRKVKDI